uniref:Glucose-6-phosphate isomerase n=1 Tax=Desulfobacca acetoxidans TaxID=60893 RepID=A0A7C5AKK1_9BACT
MKRYQDPQWVSSQAISLDYNYVMADFVGDRGLSSAELDALTPKLARVHEDLQAGRESGRYAFLDLPYRQDDLLKPIRRLAKPLLEWCWEFVILGIGGSALGAKALHQALCHPQHNFLPVGRRKHHPGLWVLDNIDPDFVYGILDGLNLKRVAVNIISKSGTTAETLAQFLWLYRLLASRVGGEDRLRERLIITTDPVKGPLRRLVEQEGFHSLSVPPDVGGRFSVLSAVGLFPAQVVGIDVEELLAGARFMDQRLKASPPEENMAYRLAAIYYLFYREKGRPLLITMPYAANLSALADWFAQLWAESLGKRLDLAGRLVETGSTPIRAVGVTDQHSQLQLYSEGPHDKLITIWSVDRFQHTLEIPSLFDSLDDMGYLGGHTLNELFKAEETATAFNLMKSGRPNLTLTLPEVNPFTVGQLIYLLEVTTVAAGGLLGVNPLDQPGVEGGKRTACALLGRPGFEEYRREFDQTMPKLSKYVIK